MQIITMEIEKKSEVVVPLPIFLVKGSKQNKCTWEFANAFDDVSANSILISYLQNQIEKLFKTSKTIKLHEGTQLMRKVKFTSHGCAYLPAHIVENISFKPPNDIQEKVVKRKLSSKDVQLLDKIVEELENINIPTTWTVGNPNNHAKKINAHTQRSGRHAVFGYLSPSKPTRQSIKHPHILPLFDNFMKSHAPEFEYDAVNVNRNIICGDHYDSKNAGTSLLVGCGKYEGGETVLYIDDKEHMFRINQESITFNGTDILHGSTPFKGLRYSFVFFTHTRTCNTTD